MRISIFILFIILSLDVAFAAYVSAQPDRKAIPYGNNPGAGAYISVKGARLYFETYGQGEPLVLIHGNGGNIAYMQP